MPWWAGDVRPLLLRRRVGRPQLKRDPVGRAVTPMTPIWLLAVPVVAFAGLGWPLRKRGGPLALWAGMLAALGACIGVGQLIVVPERAQIPRSTPVFLVLVGIPLLAYCAVLELAHRKHWRTRSAVGVAIFVASVATTFAVVLAFLVAWAIVGDR